ncbi:hypothetical protein PGTUg99_016190, partial [Puccinia graminis f. sp. tritici]
MVVGLWSSEDGDEGTTGLPGRCCFIGVAVEDPVGHKAHQPLYFVSGCPERWSGGVECERRPADSRSRWRDGAVSERISVSFGIARILAQLGHSRWATSSLPVVRNQAPVFVVGPSHQLSSESPFLLGHSGWANSGINHSFTAGFPMDDLRFSGAINDESSGDELDKALRSEGAEGSLSRDPKESVPLWEGALRAQGGTTVKFGRRDYKVSMS